MRSSKSRSRSKSSRQRTLGNIVNRVFDSSGPEGKVRGTPQQIIDKYLALARDAQLSNDRVAEESFLQHAEHYTRMLGDALREQAERQQQSGGGQGRADDDTRQDARQDESSRGDGRRDDERRNDGRRDDERRNDDRRSNERRGHDQDRGRENHDPVAETTPPARSAAENGLPDAIGASDDNTGPVTLPETSKRSSKSAPGSASAPAPKADTAASRADEAAPAESEDAPRPARKTTRAPSRSRSARKPAEESGEEQVAAGD